MGKIINGKISGRVGNIVYAGDTVRSRPRKISIWSEAQKKQRGRMSSIIALYNTLKTYYVEPIWKCKDLKGLTAYNLFIKYSSPAFDKGGEFVDPSKFLITIGDLTNPFDMDVRRIESNKLQLSWVCDKFDNAVRAQDIMYVVYYNGERFSSYENLGVTRGDEGAEISIIENFTHSEYAYVFFGSRNSEAYTDSMSFKI